MTIEERLGKLETAWGETDPIVRELRDAFTVMSGLEARQSRMLKDHAEWLAGHDMAMAELRRSGEKHDREMTEIRENGKKLDERIAALVSAIGEFMRRGGPAGV